jgi:hypothetical protein
MMGDRPNNRFGLDQQPNLKELPGILAIDVSDDRSTVSVSGNDAFATENT